MKKQLAQLAYVTHDLDKAIDYWVRSAGAGPFFMADYEPERQMFRGEPTHITFSIGYGFIGDVHVELIQQTSGGKSAYAEALDAAQSVPDGGLFHHLMFLHDGYDEAYNGYLAAGATRCYDAYVEGVGRFCYLDARAQMGCYVEFVEDTTMFEAASWHMRSFHQNWDGSRPRRSFDEVFALL